MKLLVIHNENTRQQDATAILVANKHKILVKTLRKFRGKIDIMSFDVKILKN